MRRVAIGALLALSVLIVTAPAWASTQSEITAATSQGKAVFLVVTQANARGTDRAIQIAQQAQALLKELSRDVEKAVRDRDTEATGAGEEAERWRDVLRHDIDGLAHLLK